MEFIASAAPSTPPISTKQMIAAQSDKSPSKCRRQRIRILAESRAREKIEEEMAKEKSSLKNELSGMQGKLDELSHRL